MFAGIGGFRSGLTLAGGFECVGHCEIDKYADASYKSIHKIQESEVFYPDARQLKPREMPDFDLICGGFPCQSFSNAGKRRGFEDARGTLFFEIAEWLKRNDLRIFCLKTFRDCYRMTAAGRFLPSSPRLMTWGTASNGLCLTANILEFPNLEEGCSLSDILIPDAPEKYFLSSEQTEKLLYNSQAARKDHESTTRTE